MRREGARSVTGTGEGALLRPSEGQGSSGLRFAIRLTGGDSIVDLFANEHLCVLEVLGGGLVNSPLTLFAPSYRVLSYLITLLRHKYEINRKSPNKQ